MNFLKHKAPRSAAAEKRYMGAVAERCCELCRFLNYGETPALVHHQRTGTGKMRASHYDTCALCPEHHVGKTGVHSMGRDEFEQMHGVSELELIATTRAALAHLLPGESKP